MIKILLFVLLMSSLLISQEIKIEFETGDSDINQHLQDINNYAINNMDFFKRDLSMKFGISTKDADQYLRKDKVRPGDLYYACTIASVTNQDVKNVVKSYKVNKAWGKVTKEYGIEPGSNDFQRLKGKTLTGIGKVRTKHVENGKDNTKSKK